MTATFTCRPNSHPFQERRVSLADPVKIGRSVARARPAVNNAIFDCKVLSRNHALLWYEDGKFFLKDTKSSNGTFVNNHRLSKGAEESKPHEVNSGDIVQFGVDVIENSRKVTHGCIVSQIRLYLPNGDEAKQSDVSWTTHLIDKVPHNLVYPTIQSQDLYQLHQYLQEALHREQMLEQKLALLQRLVTDSQETSEKGWQALIDEDKLLSRLQFLENQIQTYSKTLSDESVQKELLQLQEEKHNYETTSKETLRQVLGEKLEAQQKLGSLERSFSNTEDECTHLREVLSKTQEELKDLVEKHQHHVRESQKVSEKAQDAERNHADVRKRLEAENEKHQESIEEMNKVEEELRRSFEDSQVENLRFQLEIEELKGKLERLTDSADSPPNDNELSKPDVINSNLKDKLNNVISNQGDLELKDITVSLKEDKIEVVKTIEICENPTEERMNVVDVPLTQFNNLQSSLGQEGDGSDEIEKKLRITELENRIAQLEDAISSAQSLQLKEEAKRKDAESRLGQLQEEREKEKEMLTETTRELQAALSERESLLEKEEKLRSRIEESETLLRACDTDSISSSSEAEELSQSAVDPDDDIACGSLTIAKAKLRELKKKLKEKDALLAAQSTNISSGGEDAPEELAATKSLLGDSQERVAGLEDEVKTLRASLDESSKLRKELEEARQLARDQCRLCEEAQQALQLATENDSSELQELKDQLQSNQSESKERLQELEELRTHASESREKYEELSKEKGGVEENLKKCMEQISLLQEGKGDTADLECKNQQFGMSTAGIVPQVSGRAPSPSMQKSRIPILSPRISRKGSKLESPRVKVQDGQSKLPKPSLLKRPSSPKVVVSPRTRHLKRPAAIKSPRPATAKPTTRIAKTKALEKAQIEKLEKISDAIFERVCGSEEGPALADEPALPGLLSESSSASSVPASTCGTVILDRPTIFTENTAVEMTFHDADGSLEPSAATSDRPSAPGSGLDPPPELSGKISLEFEVPPLDLSPLEEYNALLLYEAMKREAASEKEEAKIEVDEERSSQLSEDKQRLLDDMQLLRTKLEEQQASIKAQAEKSDVTDSQWKQRMQEKQGQVDAANKKFTELLAEQQKLLQKISEQAGGDPGMGWRAFQVALFAVLMGVVYLLWPLLVGR